MKSVRTYSKANKRRNSKGYLFHPQCFHRLCPTKEMPLPNVVFVSVQFNSSLAVLAPLKIRHQMADRLIETAGTAVHFTIGLLMHQSSLWSSVCQPSSPKHAFVTLFHPLWADSLPAQQESNTASHKEGGCLSQYLNKRGKLMLFKSSALTKWLGWLIWLETIYLIECSRGLS